MTDRLAPQAVADLDDIWYYIAGKSGIIDVANRLIDTITARFVLLSNHPYLGRARDDDFSPGSRSFPVGEYVIVYCVEDGDVLILRVAHGRRDMESLFDR